MQYSDTSSFSPFCNIITYVILHFFTYMVSMYTSYIKDIIHILNLSSKSSIIIEVCKRGRKTENQIPSRPLRTWHKNGSGNQQLVYS